jgi:ABC-2 type transport system ATP-binding protein
MSMFGEANYKGEFVIKASDITFGKGKSRVENLSFQINPGDIFGIVGTFIPEACELFKILVGIAKPLKGSVLYQPYGDIKTVNNLGRLGVYLRGSALVPELTLLENLELAGRLRGAKNPSSAASEILSIFDLDDFSNIKVKSLAKNLELKATVIATFVNFPDFIFLDDFTTLLDKDSANSIVNFLKSESGLGKCVCVLTDEPEDMCNRVLMLRGLRGPTIGPPSSILESTLGFETVEVKVRGLRPSDAERILTPIQGSWLFESDEEATLYVDNTQEVLDHLFRSLVSSGVKILRVGLKRPTFRLILRKISAGGEQR